MALNNAIVGQALVGQAQVGNSETVKKRRYIPKIHGATFAPFEMPGEDILTNGKNAFLDWDLVPNPPLTVVMPEDTTPTVTIPGAIYVPELRLTGVTGGRPTFGMRSDTWKFRPRRGGLWARRFSDIANYLNGRLLKVVLDDEKGYYYVGTVFARQWGIGDMVSSVSMTYKFRPYKYELTDSMHPWYWDPFSFVDGVIRDYRNMIVSGSRTLTVYGREMPVIPDFYPETNGTGLTVTFNGQTYQLYATKDGVIYDGVHPGLTGYTVQAGTTYDPNSGRFTVSGIDIVGEQTLTFAGNGTVSVDYRGGRL